MKKDIHIIAGTGFSDEDRATVEACLNEIEPAIRRLRAQGRSPSLIVAALAMLSARTIGDQSRH